MLNLVSKIFKSGAILFHPFVQMTIKKTNNKANPLPAYISELCRYFTLWLFIYF
ncbi:hypothetical protein [Bacillus weihaiensis]|uniref:hypothetical protein n=1 Tax=Bacillus weihaiensis TaxID=1547283 RepID=UPI003B848192